MAYSEPSKHRQQDEFPARAEMINPVALVRSQRIPDEGVGFVQRLIAYQRGLAKYSPVRRRPLAGDNADPGMIHRFTVDYAGCEIGISDYVIRGRTKFRVEATRNLEQRGTVRFVVLDTTETGQIPVEGDASVVIVMEGEEGELENEVTPQLPANPFWTTEE